MKPLKTGSLASRRGRTIAIAGVSAIALLAPFVTATAASAATPPKITVDLPATVQNNAAATSWSIKVENPADGATLTGVTGKITVTLPVGLTCAAAGPSGLGLGLAGAGTAGFRSVGALAAPDATKPNVCVADVVVTTDGTDGTNDGKLIAPGGSFTSSSTTFTVNGGAFSGVTGDLTVDFSLYQAGTTAAIASGSDTAAVVAPAAPSFAPEALPAPTSGKVYRHKLVANAGVPGATYRAVGAHLNTNGSYTYTAGLTAVDNLIALKAADGGTTYDSGFSFNVRTGQIVSNGPVTPNVDPYWTWTIIANNGQGGAAGTIAAAGYVPALAQYDVASQQFRLASTFKDYSTTSTFGKEVYALAGAGVIAGYADGSFGPSKDVSRAAFAAYAVRTLDALGHDFGGAAPSGVCTAWGTGLSAFNDVKNNSEFCAEINWLYEEGITTGYSDGGFHPTAPITRQAIAAFFARIDALPVDDGVSNGPAAVTPKEDAFNDVEDNPFADEIAWLAGSAITTGYADGGFHPLANTSREAAAAFFYRFGNLENQELNSADLW